MNGQKKKSSSPLLRVLMDLGVLFVLLFQALNVNGQIGHNNNNNFCRISTMHTLCQFQRRSPTCSNTQIVGLTNVEKSQIISLHNKLRSTVAMGQERRGKPGPQPSASNMMEMKWDEELERIAQAWAEQCNFGHDKSRNVNRFQVGQNVYETTRSLDQPVEEMLRIAITGWYDEVKEYNNREVSHYVFSTVTGHYTQMVWANTDRIGCGHISYVRNNLIKKYLVCNYGPSGNFVSSQMYQIGKACGQCGNTCSRKFPGLCQMPSSSLNPVPIPNKNIHFMSQFNNFNMNASSIFNQNSFGNSRLQSSLISNPFPVMVGGSNSRRPHQKQQTRNNNNNGSNNRRPPFNRPRPTRRPFNFMHMVMGMFRFPSAG